ncbi:MAG: hypothetical protein H6811_05290 [Phycisphaeraceae bacterium]|nr:hypothetical protein [Phycisphaeraceae bacterium]
MLRLARRPALSALTLLAVVGLPLAAPTLAAEPPGETAEASAEALLLRASDLLQANQPVRARAVLLGLLESPEGLSNRERDHAFQMCADASRKVRQLPPAELSLQKAEVAFEEGDLIVAQRHAEAVMSSQGVERGRLVRAERLLDSIGEERLALQSRLDGTLERIGTALDGADLASAQTDLSWIVRSGIALTPGQQAQVEDYQMRALGEEARPAPVTLSIQPDQPATEPPVDDLIGEANRQEAARLMAEADRAVSQGRLRDALNLYQQVQREYVGSLDANQQADLAAKVTDMQVRLQDQPNPDVDEVVRQREAARQEVRASFETYMADAQRALDSGNFSGAREAVGRANLRLDGARDLFSTAEYDTRRDRSNTLAAQIDQRAEDARIATIRAKEAELAQLADQERRERELDRQRRINEAIIRVRDLQLNRQYREAIDVVEQQILFLDPNNPQGLLLKDILHDAALFQEWWALRTEKRANIAELIVDNAEAAIPPLSIVNYPKDWPQLSYLRSPGSQYAQSPENRAVLAAIHDRNIPRVDFSNNTLDEALGYLQQYAQVNMDVEWPALAAANIPRESLINLSLRNVPVETVLERVLEKVGDPEFGEKASWTVKGGVLLVSSDQKIRSHKVTEVYEVGDLIIEVPDYTEAPVFDLASVLQARSETGGASPFSHAATENGWNERPTQERLDRLKDLIRETVDFEGWRDNGGDTGSMHDWNGQLIVTNTPANHQQIRGLLSTLRDVRAMQINVEARFMLVSQDFFEQIGFDFDVYFNANNNQIAAARATDPTILPSDFFNDGRLLRDVQGSTQPPGGTAVGTLPPANLSPIGTTSNSLGIASSLLPSQGIASQILGGAPALGVAGTFLDDVQVDFLVQATQADRRTVTLTAPRLTFTNGQTSNIYVVTQVGFISDLQPIVSDSAVGFDPTIDVISEGVRLIAEGTISADRRYVTLNVDAAIAKIEGFESQPVTAVAGGQLVSSQDTQSFIQVPTTTVTRVQTTVTVPDQGTILLGGQRLVSEFEVESGVPVLSKIPIVNRFFSNRIESKEESTLLILLKPTVLIQSEQEESQFPGLLDTLGGT